MINVTKTYLPPFEDYTAILKRAWDKAWITNNGELLQELEHKLKDYLATEHLFFCTNGTIVLQMALKAFDISKEVITTPFSYVATTNAILWEGCTPVFVDINHKTLCIDVDKIEEAITENTQAILATHVFGLPCDVEKIELIAKKHQLKVIYDCAHAFGCVYKGRSLLSYGDIATCSFHATKLFHTVEGGCIVSHDDETSRKLFLFRQFGHNADDYFTVGINGKNSEFHAAMGLAILPKVDDIIAARKNVFDQYNTLLKEFVVVSDFTILNFEYNYSYYPILFEDEVTMLKAKELLQKNKINTRRYFYPSLNTLPFIQNKKRCPVSEDISKRILCLPLYHDLNIAEISMIAHLVLKCVSKKLIIQKA